MPNRMLRDWTRSDKINTLSSHAERFFTRLIMKADDYGCYYGDPRMLKADLYPLMLDGVREADISRWMAECQKAGLIVLYEAESKKYAQIIDFRQRLDKAKAKFPLPTSGNSLTTSTDFPAEEEVELETEARRDSPPVSLRDSNLYRQPTVPNIDQVIESFIRRGGTEEMARKFFLKHKATGWFIGNTPIKNFESLIPSFIHHWEQNNKKGNGKKEMKL